MKSIHRRIVIGLSVATLLTGAGIASVANASETPAPSSASPVRLLVGLRTGVPADVALPTLGRFGLAGADAKGNPIARRLLSQIRAKSVEVPGNRAAAVTAALKLDPNVSYVQVDPHVSKLDAAPTDPYFTGGDQPELTQLNVPAAWNTTTGTTVKVAVLDTGVTPISELQGKVLNGYNFVRGNTTTTDDEGHGTWVASLIAAKHNGAGMAGVCARCEILPVKVLNSKGDGYHSDIANGIMYAVDQGAKIINLSLGGTGSSAVLQDAVAWANGQGALVVAAAGNAGNTVRNYPAAYADVLAVGATDTKSAGGRAKAKFSSHGSSWVDVAAPGITLAWGRDNRPYEVQGTSFSAPLVAGVAALVASQKPAYSGWSLYYSIVKSARPIGSWVQYGLVDAAGALSIGTDGVKPVATGVNPAQWALVRGTAAVSATGVKETGSGIRAVELFVDSKWHSWDYTAPFAPPLRTAGRNNWIKVQLRLTDKAGNQTWTPMRTVVADNILPAVSITKAPAHKARVKGTVKTTVKATDANKISKVQLLVNGKVVATDTKAGYVLSFKVASQKKTMKVRVRAYDRAGNVRYTTTRTYYRA